MSHYYVASFVIAIALLPALIFHPWNGGARWMRRRRAAMGLPLAAFLFAGCNLGAASEATVVGCGNLPCDAGMGGAPSFDASVPCAEQAAACSIFPHVVTCSFYDGGPCQFGQCVAPWLDCNNDLTDGCETDTNTDPKHCGACNVACAMSCVDGVCK